MNSTIFYNAGLLFFSSLVVVLFLLPLLTRAGRKIGLLDFPNKRKVHIVPKPRVGGLGMLIGFAFASLLFLPLSDMRGYFAALILLASAGLVDDIRGVSHRLKFAIQAVAAILIVHFDGVVLHSFGNLLGFGDLRLGAFSVPLTIFCVVGVTNALNMIDGLDGLAGGVSLISLVAFGILSSASGHTELMLLSVAMAGAIIGFLRYNWHPSKLFMGDTGSMMLGFTLAYLSVAITQSRNSTVPPVAPLLILAIPITDTVTVMVKRVWSGKSPFRPDRYHLHHILLRFGIRNDHSVSAILIMSVLFACFALMSILIPVSEQYLFGGFLLFFVLYFAASFHLKRLIRYKVRVKRRTAETPKRNYLRRPAEETILFVTPDMGFDQPENGRRKGKLLDVCDGGFCMLTDCPLELGHTITIIGNGNDKHRTDKGRVLWAKRINGHFKVGVTYKNLTY